MLYEKVRSELYICAALLVYIRTNLASVIMNDGCAIKISSQALMLFSNISRQKEEKKYNIFLAYF